ncbi:short-chain dehydrogenase [Variovorax sp. WS11]|uniref:SDR family NAD(P)-dependent oxidoreductase n=1 Tax=Variovorax sp. WS11 TaxID=1105204 RepID=UPI000D0DB7EF|nr:SDR family NAD(P)-dependent oxidoreductase [Variovorax sp. WS11]NDZ18171.1 SDR family oxidoreductase [Variovorax sp. WS11]PSL80587.1 short-chain dehydrogenase [Variovorax sp. WS11]
MRIALITGAAGGLGLASARKLAEDGLRVAVADLSAAAAERAAASLPGSGHIGLACNVAEEGSVRAAFDTVERKLGPVEVLACFAGVLSIHPAPGRLPTVDITLEEWDGVMRVNAAGTFLCVREMLRRCAGRTLAHGRIVTVASAAGQMGGLNSGAAYSASKGAVLALSKVAAREAAPLGITVNTIAPGPIDTPMLHQTVPAGHGDQKFLGTAAVPLGRIGQPEEIASALSYLVSPGAGFVTGATIDVNGGMLMR